MNLLFDISALGNSHVLIGWLALKLAKSCQKMSKFNQKLSQVAKVRHVALQKNLDTYGVTTSTRVT